MMSLRSLLTITLLAAVVLATPPGYGGTTVTVTKTVTASGSCSSSSPSSSSPLSSNSTSSTLTSSPASNTKPTTTLLATATSTSYGLNDAAKVAGKLWFGTAADIPGPEQADYYYMREFNNTHDFGEATPANIMKFEFTEPEQGVFNFTGAQEFLDVAKATGKYVRCHNLIWESELPTWVTSPSVNWTNETLSKVLYEHVYTLVEHFGDQCYSWDVVNEALSDSPAGAYQSNIWYDTIGAAYVVEAYQAATDAVRKNNLGVKLYYNDYNIEYPGNKSTAAQSILKELKGRGIQIDGVGLESHFIGTVSLPKPPSSILYPPLTFLATAGETPSQSSQTSNMQAFTSLDIDVAVTELDVRLTLPPTADSEAQQVADYYSTVAACVAVERCIGITVWDFDDTYSWVPSTFAGQGYADLFLQPGGANTPLVRKAAYDGVLEALKGRGESSP
jgi:endo-1,4-beta-xylanase